MRRRGSHFARSWLRSAIASACLGACAVDATQIVVTVDVDPAITQGPGGVIDAVRVSASAPGGALVSRSAPLAATSSQGLHLPLALLAVTPRAGAGAPTGAFIRAEGLRAGRTVVDRSLVTAFEPGRRRDLTLVLTSVCLEVQCPVGQTCESGAASDAGAATDASSMDVPGRDAAACGCPDDGGYGAACCLEASAYCTPVACGTPGAICCDGTTCDAGAACVGGVCVACGATGQACCAGATCTAAGTGCGPDGVCRCGFDGGPCCVGATPCLVGRCVGATCQAACGAQNQPCCAGACGTHLGCYAGRCACGHAAEVCCNCGFGCACGTSGLGCVDGAMCSPCGDVGLPCCPSTVTGTRCSAHGTCDATRMCV